MSVFYIPNHSSQTLNEVELEALTTLPPRPHFALKSEMLAWSHEDTTNHCYYNLAEPKDRARRLNTKDNPVVALHGVVADFDSKISAGMLMDGLARVSVDCPVAYSSKTFSGGVRLVWLFEKPLQVISTNVAKDILKRLAKEMKLNKLLLGFDEGAFLDTARYFELGTDWTPVKPDGRINQNTLEKIRFDACQKTDWTKAGGPQIPIEDVAAEVERRWPNRWHGPFAVGSMGPRFWDPSADNPKGCWIRETGVVAFTGEGKFLHWDEVLGKKFVDKYEADRIGGAVAGAHFDGRAYWIKNGVGIWKDYPTELMRLDLRRKGLSSEGKKGQMSEVDRAVAHIAFESSVDGGFPFLFNDRELVTHGARTYLNTSRVKAKGPADGHHEWGQDFQWIAAFLKNAFQGEQLDALLSWHRHYWFNAWQSRTTKGHALFIAGPAGLGKTLLSHRIIGASVGGAEEISAFLMGKTEYNAPMFESALGTVDDAVAAADRRSHDVYTQIVKKLVANPTLTYRRMYANPVTMPYYGRIIVTLNDDPVSISMLPSTDGSILDKMVFLRASAPAAPWPANVEEIISRELPHYLAFLRDYKIPANMVGDPRFGMVAFKDESMVQSARANSSSAEFSELLDLWKAEYFRQEDGKTWEGTAAQLMQDFQNTETIKELAKVTARSTVGIGRMMSQLATTPDSGVTIASSKTSKGRIFVVSR